MPLARAPVIKAAWAVSAVLPHHNRIIPAHVASIKVPSLFRYLKEIEKGLTRGIIRYPYGTSQITTKALHHH